MAIIRECGYAMPEVHKHMTLKEFMLAAVAENGCDVLRFAPTELQTDKDTWITAVLRDGNDLQHAPEQLKKDHDVVIAAVKRVPEALQHAMGGLHHGPECLRISGNWDEKNVTHSHTEQVILSMKISPAEQSTPYAMQFALAMKDDTYLGQFTAHNPMVWSRKSCDPNFTDIQSQCRGTLDTCLISADDNLTAEKRLANKSCWRFAFRFHQEECKATNGFMIQVQEVEGLGAGQKIETEMANQVGLKVFRIRSHQRYIDGNRMASIGRVVKGWYDSGRQNVEIHELWI